MDKENEVMVFARKCIQLEIIILNKSSHSQNRQICLFSFITPRFYIDTERKVKLVRKMEETCGMARDRKWASGSMDQNMLNIQYNYVKL